jgi:hypothetical protein
VLAGLRKADFEGSSPSGHMKEKPVTLERVLTGFLALMLEIEAGRF